MAQQTIKLKRSGTSGNVPSVSDLALGEVAINTYDGKMYIKKNTGTSEVPVESIVRIGDHADQGYSTSDTYVNSASFDTATGVVTLDREPSGAPDVTVDLDGRYLQYGETQNNASYLTTINQTLTTSSNVNHNYLTLGSGLSVNATGVFATNTSSGSISAGNTVTNGGYCSLGIGMNHNIAGNFNLISGYQNTTNVGTVDSNIIGGSFNHSESNNGFIAGRNNTINSGSVEGTIIGSYNSIGGGSSTSHHAFSGGYQSRARASVSFAFGATSTGIYTTADSANSFAIQGGTRVHGNAVNGFACGMETRVGNDAPSAGETASQGFAQGFQSRVWRNNGFAGGNSSNCFSDSGLAFGNGSTASDKFSNIALGYGVTTSISSTTAEDVGQVVVGVYNKYDSGENEYFSVGTGVAEANRYTSFSIQDRTSTSVADTSGFCGIVMKALAESAAYGSDSTAAAGGVPIGGLYRYTAVSQGAATANRIRIRVT